MIAKQPQKTYAFGDTLPAIPGPVASWPWRASSALTTWSVDMLRYPLGTLIYDVVDGHPVIAQIQTHSWFGAHPDWPSKPHKGTSVFVPTTVDASGKKVAVADPPDGWGEASAYGPFPTTGVGACAQGDPLCTDLPDESAPPPAKKHPMNTDTVFLNGRPVSGFGVGENFCPSLPYVCPPRPWGPDPGPNASIADRLGTGKPSVGVDGLACWPREWRPDEGQFLGDASGPYAQDLARVGLHPDHPDEMYKNLLLYIANPAAFKARDPHWPGKRDNLAWWTDASGTAILNWPFHGGKWYDSAPKTDAQVRAVFKVPHDSVKTGEWLAKAWGFPANLPYKLRWEKVNSGFDLIKTAGSIVDGAGKFLRSIPGFKEAAKLELALDFAALDILINIFVPSPGSDILHGLANVAKDSADRGIDGMGLKPPREIIDMIEKELHFLGDANILIRYLTERLLASGRKGAAFVTDLLTFSTPPGETENDKGIRLGAKAVWGSSLSAPLKQIIPPLSRMIVSLATTGKIRGSDLIEMTGGKNSAVSKIIEMFGVRDTAGATTSKPVTVPKPVAPVAAASKTPTVPVPAATAPATASPATAYGPYPQPGGSTAGVGALDHGGGGGHGGGGHGGGGWHGGGRRIFRGGGGGWGRGGWGWGYGPWWPYVVVGDASCASWGDPVRLPVELFAPVRDTLRGTGGGPVAVRGADGGLYLLSLESVRPCVGMLGVGGADDDILKAMALDLLGSLRRTGAPQYATRSVKNFAQAWNTASADTQIDTSGKYTQETAAALQASLSALAPGSGAVPAAVL